MRILLKRRPAAIGLLNKRKVRFWDALDKPVWEVLRPQGLEDFLEEVSNTHQADPDTEWSAMPLYVLVDYLTQEHRTLLTEEFTEMNHLFNIYCLSEARETVSLKELQSTFNAFQIDFESHIEAEETTLFPKILRYEACQVDRNVHPEFHRGSLQMYPSTHQAKVDRQFFKDADSLALRLKSLASQFQESAVVGQLAELMESLRIKLAEHANLTGNSLLPIACELERSLYNRTIDGDPALAVSTRGPMDSGIMRLNLG